jgi:type II secretory ATPase GspE/PulE/Tfp pilus assembly ATPase PilB-like protein
MTGNIIGIISQRLIRLLCPSCKSPRDADEADSKLLGVEYVNESLTIYEASGCPNCDNTGYKGRVAIIEALRIDNQLDEQIGKRATLGELRACAKTTGYKTLADDAIRRVLDGETSLQEVARVIDLTQRLI